MRATGVYTNTCIKLYMYTYIYHMHIRTHTHTCIHIYIYINYLYKHILIYGTHVKNVYAHN